MRHVVVVAQFTERSTATFHMAVIADGSTAVGALSYGSLTTGHPNVVVSEFNLTVHDYRTITGLTAQKFLFNAHVGKIVGCYG
jgi:hypothetical protein